MWGPDVLSSKLGFQNPLPSKGSAAPGLWRTPTTSQARFSDLKTRVIEHSWLQNKPSAMVDMTTGKWNLRGKVNPDQVYNANSKQRPEFQMGDPSPGGGMKQPWWFNEASMSLPNALFFDSHVGPIGVLESVNANARVAAKNTTAMKGFKGLFVESGLTGTSVGDGSPLSAPYYQYGCYDNQASTGCAMHILTVDGITGRDMLGAQ